MIEEYCRWNVWNKCQKETGVRPLVCLKGESPPVWEWDGFFDGMNAFNIVWSRAFERKRGVNMTFRLAVGLFSRMGDVICQGWIDDAYDGDWKRAMREHKNFNAFFDGFVKYFGERRKAFMEKSDALMQKVGAIKTSSHGGVANLLKVLTKTMNAQGSSIRTIAKVQYTICMQAGIYIPDEFVTDVLVGAEIAPKLFEEDKKEVDVDAG